MWNIEEEVKEEEEDKFYKVSPQVRRVCRQEERQHDEGRSILAAEENKNCNAIHKK